jgi:hypothetical protein
VNKGQLERRVNRGPRASPDCRARPLVKGLNGFPACKVNRGLKDRRESSAAPEKRVSQAPKAFKG